jgi:hypothetical protein
MHDTFCLVSEFALRSNILRRWKVLEKGILNYMDNLFQCYGSILACYLRFLFFYLTTLAQTVIVWLLSDVYPFD